MSLRFYTPRVALAACFFFFSCHLFAQYQDGLALLKEKKYTEAASSFQSLSTTQPTLTLLGMSKYYSTVGNPEFQLDSAYHIALRAEKTYKALDERDKDRLGKTLAGDTPAKNRQSIERKYIDDVLAKKELNQLNRAMEVLGSSAKTKTIEETRNSVAYTEANKVGTITALAKFLDDYSNSLKLKSPAIFRLASYKLFDLYTQSKGWSAHPQFKVEYSLAAWARDSVVWSLENARKSNFNVLEAFIKKYPNTSFAKIALDTLSAKILRQAPWRYCLLSLQNWKDIPRKDSIWLRLYQGYRVENPSVKQLAAFKTRFPDFPHPELLKKDETTALAFYYNAVVKSDSIVRLRRFINDYPNEHPMVDTIWEKYAKRILASANAERVKNPARLDPITKDKNSPAHLRERFEKIQKAWVLELEEKELQRAIASRRPAELFKFIDRQPPSTFRPRAIDSLTNLLVKSDSIKAIKRILRYPNLPRQADLMDRLYHLSKQTESIATLREFITEYPQYKPDTLKQDLAELEARVIFKATYNEGKWPVYNEYIRNWAPSYFAFFALQRIISEDVKNDKWSAVVDSMDRYAPYFKGKNAQYDDMYKSIKETGKISNYKTLEFLADERFSVYSPCLTLNDRQLFLCRYTGYNQEDVYISQKVDSGWTKPVVIPEFGDARINEAPLSASQNGNDLLLFIRGMLCESKKTASGWSAPKQLPSTVNFTAWQGDAHYINDNGIIYSVQSPSQQQEIYVCFKNEDGQWGTPINVGPNINTAGNDRAPYLHSDMKTLYFSSNGHPGFGDLDLFMTTRLDDTWTNWSPPKNLGLFFNSDKKDWDFKLNAAGNLAYFSVGSSDDSKVVFASIAEAIRPVPVYRFEAVIVDPDKKPFEGQIQALDNINQKVLSTTRPALSNGYTTVISSTDKVRLIAIPDEDGSVVVINRSLKLIDPKAGESPQKDTIVIGKTKEITVETFLFATGSWDVHPDSYLYLDAWAKQIQKKKLRIEIQGHTDNTSSAEFNQSLSEKRANAIRDYLINKGCTPEYIIAKGLGENNPIASNNTEDGRAKNRRVIFKQLD